MSSSHGREETEDITNDGEVEDKKENKKKKGKKAEKGEETKEAATVYTVKRRSL